MQGFRYDDTRIIYVEVVNLTNKFTSITEHAYPR
jgi:hypothetical protein